MNIVNISDEYLLADYFLSNLRDSNRQKDRLHFRANVKSLSQILTWEFSKSLEYNKEFINTPFSGYGRMVPASDIILVSIVRAGIPIQIVVSSMIPCEKIVLCTCEKDARGIRSAAISDELNFHNKVLAVTESLMTSASSILCCLKEVLKRSHPSFIAILNLISTPLAIDNIKKFEKETGISINLYTCAIDNFTSGIRGTVPGLGDVGDLLYGIKSNV